MNVEIMTQDSKFIKAKIEKIRNNPRFMPIEGKIIARLLNFSMDEMGEMTEDQMQRMNEWMSQNNEKHRIQLSERVCELLDKGDYSDEEIIRIVVKEFQEREQRELPKAA